MQKINGYWYNVSEDWTPIIHKNTGWMGNHVPYFEWLKEHCPNVSEDYEVHRYNDDSTASIYFFRDPHVASMFALKFV